MVLLYSVFGSAPEMGQLRVERTAGETMNESNMSYVCPCPQSTSHHYAFMPDLCDVGDVAVSFLSALQDRTQGGKKL